MSRMNIARVAVIAGVALLVAGVVVLKQRTVTASGGKGAGEPVVGGAAVAGGELVSASGSNIPDDPLEITANLDLDRLRSHGVPVILDFGSKSCAPCRQMAPIIEELHGTLRGKAIIRYVDVWQYPELAKDFPLEVIPTQFFFDSSGKPFEPSESLGIPFTMFSSRDTGELALTRHEGGLSRDELIAVLEAMGMSR